MSDRSDLEYMQELFDFLQGVVPEGHEISDRPNLTAEQAWTVCWYLGNQYHQYKDYIERCDICGDLFDSTGEGDVLDYGESPFFFCDPCCNSKEYNDKLADGGPE